MLTALVHSELSICLGLRKIKDAGNANQAHLTMSSSVALFLVAFILQQASKRRCPMCIQICPGVAKFLLAGSILLGSCADTAVAGRCTMSIALKDEFGDPSTVVRYGETFHVFCEGPHSWKKLMVGETKVLTSPGKDHARSEMVVKIIWSDSKKWAVQKRIFSGKFIKCGSEDTEDYSKEAVVPYPILCRAGSQVVCEEGKICSVDPDTGNEACTEDAKMSHCGTAVWDKETYLCHPKFQSREKECANVGKPKIAWPEFEVPEDDEKMCDG